MPTSCKALLFAMATLLTASIARPEPEPFINPMGSLAKCEKVRYRGASKTSFTFPGPDGKKVRKKVEGEAWRFSVPHEGKEKAAEAIATYLEGKGARILVRDDKKLVATATDGEGATWWAAFTIRRKDYMAYVSREQALVLGPFKVTPYGGAVYA